MYNFVFALDNGMVPIWCQATIQPHAHLSKKHL